MIQLLLFRQQFNIYTCSVIMGTKILNDNTNNKCPYTVPSWTTIIDSFYFENECLYSVATTHFNITALTL